MMLKIDQFIYTTGSLSGKKGYQVVAKSKAITNEIISQMDPYLYPIGVNTSKFKESKSLIILKKNQKIAFSKIRNIGIGYDGRSNTLYNHTLLMDLDDFAQINNDTRVLDNFYFENYSIQGNLSQLKIEPKKLGLPLEEIKKISDSLHEIFLNLFNKKKIALLGIGNSDTIQMILGLIPPTMRLISFSTLVNDVKKQPHYDFIITSSPTLNSRYHKIELNSTKSHIVKQKKFEQSVNYYLELIFNNKNDELNSIHDLFEKNHDASYKNKLILLTNYSQFEHAETDKKSDYADNILTILKEFDDNTFSDYFKKIQNYVKKPIRIQTNTDSLINPYAALIELCLVLPQKMMANLFNMESDSINLGGEDIELTDKKDSCLSSSLSDKQKKLIPKRGDIFTEEKLCTEFAVRNTGGIRPSISNKCIVLIHSSYNPNIARLEQYSDMVDESHEYLIYTGEGSGDQKMMRNNKAILESFEAGRMMLYFDKPRRNYLEYQFRVCYESHYWDTERNSNGEDRKVIRFKLRICDD